jgi:hypothetical protein
LRGRLELALGVGAVGAAAGRGGAGRGAAEEPGDILEGGVWREFRAVQAGTQLFYTVLSYAEPL